MRFTLATALIALAAGPASALTVDPQAIRECGALGVMEVPEGEAHPENYRKCKEHPLSLLPGGMPTPSDASDDSLALEGRAADADPGHRLFARACLKGDATIGCEKGYCWKACGKSGSRQWCWMADKLGKGGWTTCSSALHCLGKSVGSDQRADCSVGNCKACGCGC
ncbi:hypothetical protein RB595_008202 [Gaeumannomyces hyphopodioides]